MPILPFLVLIFSFADVLTSAEAINGTSLNGEPVRVEMADGPVLLVFWASWCNACRREMPGLNDFHARSGTTVRVIGVGIDEQVEDARQVAAGSGLTYLNLADPQMVIADSLSVTSTPTLILLGRDGKELGRGSTLGRLREPLAALGLSP